MKSKKGNVFHVSNESVRVLCLCLKMPILHANCPTFSYRRNMCSLSNGVVTLNGRVLVIHFGHFRSAKISPLCSNVIIISLETLYKPKWVVMCQFIRKSRLLFGTSFGIFSFLVFAMFGYFKSGILHEPIFKLRVLWILALPQCCCLNKFWQHIPSYWIDTQLFCHIYYFVFKKTVLLTQHLLRLRGHCSIFFCYPFHVVQMCR